MLSGWKRIRKPGKSAEGSAALPVLVCFLACSILISLVTAKMETRLWLMKAGRQSAVDLAIIDQAKGYIREIQSARKCGTEMPETVRQLPELKATLEYSESWIEVETDKESYRLWYDAQGIYERQRH